MALTQPALIPQPWGSDGQVGNIPQDSSEFGKASWAKGFPAETAQPLTEGGIPPSYLDFQGVLNALSTHAVFMQSGAHYAWSNTLDYPVGCFVLGSDGKLYQSLQNSGPGYSAGAKNPTASPAYWSVNPLASDIAELQQKDAEQDIAIAAAQNSADALATSKAGVNAENFSAEGRGLLAGIGMPMPSKDYKVDLQIGASGTRYTAPQNGWFEASCRLEANKYILFTSPNGGPSTSFYSSATVQGRIFLPIAKGAVVQFNYSITPTSDDKLIFWPSVGEITNE